MAQAAVGSKYLDMARQVRIVGILFLCCALSEISCDFECHLGHPSRAASNRRSDISATHLEIGSLERQLYDAAREYKETFENLQLEHEKARDKFVQKAQAIKTRLEQVNSTEP